MSDLTVNGTLYLNGILWLVGGANTFMQDANLTEVEIVSQIAAWGLTDGGRRWFNTTSAQWEGWNGTGRVILG